MPRWKLVNTDGIEVQADIGVARTQVTAGVVRILFDRDRRRTAPVCGIGINAVRPGEIDGGIEPMPVALAIGSLQSVVILITIVGQLHDVFELGHAIQLEHRIKRPRTISGFQLVAAAVQTTNGAVIQAAHLESICCMGAKVAHGDCVVSEKLVLNRGTVILDSWRLQIRNGSENVKRGCAGGIGAKGWKTTQSSGASTGTCNS